MPVANSVAEKITDIFQAVQYNRTSHVSYLKKLSKIYCDCDLDTFYTLFIKCLRLPLTYMEKLSNVEYVLQFAAKFTISLQNKSNKRENGTNEVEEEEEEEDMHVFIVKIFEFLLSHHNAKDVAVRFRICYFLNMLLDTMGDNASIDDELCNKIMQSMMDRIQDKSPKVRAQAAIALYRLQEPNNPNCSVMNVYLFHLSKDPSAEVRRVILAKMAKNKQALHAAIKRTRDVDDSVRKMAYLFISKITVKSLTMSQREQLINHGLKDKSDAIKKCVKDILVPSWLRYYDNHYINFIKAIDAEQASETIKLALDCVFKNSEMKSLLEHLPVDDNKFVPVEQLTSENVLYWHLLGKYLKDEGLIEEFESIMPELTPLTNYIREYIKVISDKNCKQWEPISQQFILLQLFEMVKLYDLSDESGRKNLKELIMDTLTNEDCSEKVSECLVKYFEEVVPDTNGRVALLVEVINEKRMPIKATANVPVPMTEDERHDRKMIRAKLGIQLLELEDNEYAAIQAKDYGLAQEIQIKVATLKEKIEVLSAEVETRVPEETEKSCEEKNDPETLIQCLQIMYFMMQSPSIKVLTPTLRSLMDSLVVPYFNSQQIQDLPKLYGLCLNSIGLCCHVDKELAKKYLTAFFIKITETENEDVWVILTKIIFDLLLKHGLECFNITESTEDMTKSVGKKSRSVRLYCHTDEDSNVNENQMDAPENNQNVVKVLMSLLDSHVQRLQTVATEGLCKLLLHSRISSSHLISQLLILWHNPTIKDNTYLMQCLCTFFNFYVSKVQDSHSVLEEAYFPTLKIIVNAPELSPLQEIDLLKISQIIINLTCCSIHNTFSIHNNMTFAIINEALNPDTDIPLEILIKSLKYLDVQFESQDSKDNITVALEKLEDMLDDNGDRRLLSCLRQFRAKILAKNGENTENPDAQNSNNEGDQEKDQDNENEDEMDQDRNDDDDDDEGEK